MIDRSWLLYFTLSRLSSAVTTLPASLNTSRSFFSSTEYAKLATNNRLCNGPSIPSESRNWGDRPYVWFPNLETPPPIAPPLLTLLNVKIDKLKKWTHHSRCFGAQRKKEFVEPITNWINEGWQIYLSLSRPLSLSWSLFSRSRSRCSLLALSVIMRPYLSRSVSKSWWNNTTASLTLVLTMILFYF